jgi:TRAP-type C4-dicarboxylate transport system permease small subunit
MSMPVLHALRTAIIAAERITTRAMTVLACAALTLAVVLACYQIVMRYVLRQSTAWSEPVLQLAIIYMVYLGLAVTFRRGALVSIDLLKSLATGRLETALRWFILICVLILLGHMFWYGWAMAARAQANIHPTLGISMMWAFAAIPVGAVLAMIAVVAHHLDPPPRQIDLGG